MDQLLPTGPYVRRRLENNFKPERRNKYMAMYHWMDYFSELTGKQILHTLNYGKEKRCGPFPVDGYCAETNEVLQYHGCFHHGHQCKLTKIAEAKTPKDQKKKRERTKSTIEFIKRQGHSVIEIWEFEFNELERTSPRLQEIIQANMPKFFQCHKRSVTEEEILRSAE